MFNLAGNLNQELDQDLILSVDNEFQENTTTPMKQDGAEQQTLESAIPTALAPPAGPLTEEELAKLQGLAVTVQSQAEQIKLLNEELRSIKRTLQTDTAPAKLVLTLFACQLSYYDTSVGSLKGL